MRVDVVSLDGRTMPLEFPNEGPVTLTALKTQLSRAYSVDSDNCSLFFGGKLVTRATRITPQNNLTVYLIEKTIFPQKAYPGSDLSFPVDRLRFAVGPDFEDIPTADVPTFMRCTRENSQIQEMASEMARAFCNSGTPPQVEYPDRGAPLRNRRRITACNAAAEEEQTGEEEASEEEDLDAILELRDSFEENLSPEHEEMVERLATLGFDRNFITPILFMSQGDEVRTREFLTNALQLMGCFVTDPQESGQESH